MTGDGATRSEPQRRQAWLFGLRAETITRALLRLKGYQVLFSRYKTPVGEIDIIARKRNLLAFVEVKARARTATAAEAIDQRQRRRIEQASQAFLARYPGFAVCDQRFDAVLVAPGKWPQHLTDAWRPGW